MPRPLRRLGSVFLILLASGAGLETARVNLGVDLFQYWVVAEARGISGGALRDPYRQRVGFESVIRTIARAPGPERVRQAAAHVRYVGLNQSPLVYWLAGQLPRDYDLAYRMYVVIALLACAAGLTALGRSLGWGGWETATAVAVTVLAYEPLSADLRVGNSNCLQFAAIAVLAAALATPVTGTARTVMLVTGIAVTMLLKPTAAPAAAALGLVAWHRLGTRRLARTLPVAAVAVLAVVVTSAWPLGSVGVWAEWLVPVKDLAQGVGPLVERGSHGPLSMLRGPLGMSTRMASVSIGTALLAALAWSWRRRRTDLDVPGLPFAALAVSIGAAFSLAPLVWLHYYVLALAPAVWLAGAGGSSAPWAMAVLLLASARLDPLVAAFGWDGSVPWLHAASAPALFWAGLSWFRAGPTASGEPST